MLRSSCSLDKYVWNFYVKGAVNSLKYCYAQYINQGKSCIPLVSTVDVTFELLIKTCVPLPWQPLDWTFNGILPLYPC